MFHRHKWETLPEVTENWLEAHGVYLTKVRAVQQCLKCRKFQVWFQAGWRDIPVQTAEPSTT